MSRNANDSTTLAKARSGIAAMIEAFGEHLITIDELRSRMPDLRARETNLRNQIEALDAQLADRHAYLALAADLHGFLTQLSTNAETATTYERHRVMKLLVKDVLIGPEKITIRHRIPIRERTGDSTPSADNTDQEGEHCQPCWGLLTPPWGVPSSAGANPLPASITPAFSQSRTMSLAGKDPMASSSRE